MKSPFPGMDPFLEHHWPDVHGSLVTYAKDQLNDLLPRSLVARTEERIAIESDGPSGTPRRIAPDVRVIEPGFGDADTGGIALMAPVKLVVDLDLVTERFVRIVEEGAQEKLVTVVEFISPTNKTGIGLEHFRLKRAELIDAGVHFVEIDLVRKGDWRSLLRPHICPRESITEYRALIRLASNRQIAHLFPMPLRAALPAVPIPLRNGDPKIELDLQRLLDNAYGRGRYGETLHYDRPLDPPLSESDAAWAAKLLQAPRPK